MGILVALWGLIWPFLWPIMKLGEYMNANPDTALTAVLKVVFDFFEKLIDLM